MASSGPYSRIYHKLADEYPDIYDSEDLAPFIRLLVAADQAWPSSARWGGYATRQALSRLEAAGLVTVKGTRYRIKGMDKERDRRSRAASYAARTRWEDAAGTAHSNAVRIAESTANGSAETMPRRERDKTRRDISLSKPRAIGEILPTLGIQPGGRS